LFSSADIKAKRFFGPIYVTVQAFTGGLEAYENQTTIIISSDAVQLTRRVVAFYNLIDTLKTKINQNYI
jgi:hypothetical protein